MNESNVKNFFDAWSLYDKVLTYNYMFHEEIYRDVQHLIAGRYADRPFTLLDLGCGSARHLARALKGSAICRYSGYDLSAMALAYATRNLASLGCTIDLHQGDLLAGLQANGEKFDLIFSSFALHHLISTDKAAFFRLAYGGLRNGSITSCTYLAFWGAGVPPAAGQRPAPRHCSAPIVFESSLSENGMLLLIDAMREENEDHELYIDRYCGWLRSAWKTMQPEELDAICDHIRNSDFPETISGLYAMATKAGFGKSMEIYGFRWHCTLCFEKTHLW